MDGSSFATGFAITGLRPAPAGSAAPGGSRAGLLADGDGTLLADADGALLAEAA